MTERVLVIGHGAREHALAHKLAYKDRSVFVMFGNAGIAREFECVNPREPGIESMADLAKKISPDLVVIGPEIYLAQGIADALTRRGLSVFGPKKEASQLESSKAFTKALCQQAHIAAARSQTFMDYENAQNYVDHHLDERIVIKVDGLCAGKGVTVCHTKQEAQRALAYLYQEDGFLNLGVHDKTIIVEDYLAGNEVSVFAAVNGLELVLFCPMQDYKRLYDSDRGPNTGGMGAVGPLGQAHERSTFLETIKEQIFLPALNALHKNNIKFSGLLYAGLMINKSGPQLLEFNVRFGDPETQALLFGTSADIYPLLRAIARGEPFNSDYWQEILLEMEPTISIVLAGSGYPIAKSQNCEITWPSSLPAGAAIYCGATIMDAQCRILSGDGRVINVVARAKTVEAARALGYGLVSETYFSGMHYRSDIGTNMTEL